MSLLGCDVSSFQGPPADWKTVTGKIAFGGVKITELQPGGVRYVNPDAAADWAFLKANGKGRSAYCFAHPSTSAAETVSFFAAELGPLGLDDNDAVALDHETTDGLSPAECSAWAADVLAGLHKTFDRIPLCYTFPNFAQTGYCDALGDYPLWISDPNHPAGHPAIPAPWHTWAIHQFATSGAIDRDVAEYRTLRAMAAALGKKEPVVTVKDWHCAGDRNLQQIGEANKAAASTILRITAENSLHREFAPDVASWLNDVFTGKTPATAPVPKGITLKGPA
jgi:hypothetical protein